MSKQIYREWVAKQGVNAARMQEPVHLAIDLGAALALVRVRALAAMPGATLDDLRREIDNLLAAE